MIASSASPGGAHGLGEPALLVVERRVEQQVGHAEHAVHRRADLVAHVGQELGLQAGRRERVVARDHELLLGAAALDELAEEAGDGRHRALEVRVAFLHGGVHELEHAEAAAIGLDRDRQRGMQPAFADDRRRVRPLVALDVGDPDGLAQLPCAPDEPLPAAERHPVAARAADRFEQLRVRRPHRGHPQRAAVDEPDAAELPAERRADGVGDPLGGLLDARRLGQHARGGVLGHRPSFCPRSLGDVADDHGRAREPSALVQWRDGVVDERPRAVLADQGQGAPLSSLPVAQRLRRGRVRVRVAVCRVRPAADPFSRGVGVDHQTVAVDRDDPVAD